MTVARFTFAGTILLVLLIGSPALAKGSIAPRVYMVIDGPGLAHPIVVSAAWHPVEGYAGDEAEIFLNWATATGAIDPRSLRPLTSRPPTAELGPLYQVSFSFLRSN